MRHLQGLTKLTPESRNLQNLQMEEIKKLTTAQLEKWRKQEPEEFGIEQFRRKYNISADCDLLYVAFNRWVEDGTLKRLRRGWYRQVKKVEPIRWWNGEEKDRLPLVWPYGVEDDSNFGFDDNVEVYSGDSIVVAGESNRGKTAFALNFLVNNLHLFAGARLMVNEYKPQRFRARMKEFNWVDFWNEDRPKFELLPVMEHHEDHIEPNFLNIIDWLHIKENFWEVASHIEEMQMLLRAGVLLAVLQKTTDKRKTGVGADWGTFFPAVYLSIGAGRLDVVKVKSAPRGKLSPEGKTYAFDIIERGSKFHNIRQVRTCPTCKGSKYMFGNDCNKCNAKGFVEIEA